LDVARLTAPGTVRIHGPNGVDEHVPFHDNQDLLRRPGYLLRRAHQVAIAIFAQEAGHLSLTPPQHNALSAIKANPGCSQADVARSVGYDRATMGAVLVGLEARGLINRRGSAKDRRLKLLTITPRGQQLLDLAEPVTERINQRVIEILAPEERETFVRLLAKIAASSPAEG
jgi:DNA-binding MarR family transcriptional regulator